MTQENRAVGALPTPAFLRLQDDDQDTGHLQPTLHASFGWNTQISDINVPQQHMCHTVVPPVSCCCGSPVEITAPDSADTLAATDLHGFSDISLHVPPGRPT